MDDLEDFGHLLNLDYLSDVDQDLSLFDFNAASNDALLFTSNPTALSDLTCASSAPTNLSPTDLSNLVPSTQHEPAINFSAAPSKSLATQPEITPDELFPTQGDLPAFDDFPSWLPRFSRPPAPCDYCTSTGFDCFFTNGDETGCSSCRSLFRACTFRHKAERSGWLDTLCPVEEDATQDRMAGQVEKRPLFSHGASMDDINASTPARSCGIRFHRTVTLVLKRWLEAHADHPYPTEEEKLELKDETGLSLAQISNWLANARRRGKVRPKRSASPSVFGRLPTQPIAIRNSPCPDHADMNPFERWKHSPPEKEAPIDLIKEAAATTLYTPDSNATGSSCSHSQTGRTVRSSGGGSWLPSSASSVAERTSSRASTNGSGSLYSHTSRHSTNSLTSTSRRRHRRTTNGIKSTHKISNTSAAHPLKIYQCTFCTDVFHIKYDWTRHEKTLHLSFEKWICAPLGPIIASANPLGGLECVYCGASNPDRAHLDTHSHSDCDDKGLQSRTFYRKDHLRQHLRLVHRTPMKSTMESWKSSPPVLRSRCGFCPQDSPAFFTTWQARADHLAAHFRAGAKMADWKGDWGFDPNVEAQVANAMPPWLIAFESLTPNPFSASAGRFGHFFPNVAMGPPASPAEYSTADAPPTGKKSTCWEVLTQGLGRYVRSVTAQGRLPGDKELQREARLLLFGEDDEWDSTAADDGEWLRLFRQAHGIAGSQCVGSGGGNKEARVVMDEIMNECPLKSAMGEMVGQYGGSTLDEDVSHGDQEFMRLFTQAGIYDGQGKGEDVEMGMHMGDDVFDYNQAGW